VALLLAATAVVFVVRKPAAQQPPPPELVHIQPERPAEPVRPQPTQPTEPVQPPPPQVEAKKKVAVNLITTPAGATVTVDGQSNGTTPMELVLEEDGPAKLVSFALRGYQEVTRAVSVQNAPKLTIELKRTPTQPVRQTNTKKPPFGIKSGR
jgi:hypothetical protein